MQSNADPAQYEEDQRGFRHVLAEHPPDGFLYSSSSALAGVSWANGGRDAYEDWYVIRSSCVLDALDSAVAAGAHHRVHARAAAHAGGGTAGLYCARLGRPIPTLSLASWFSRPDGTTSAQVLDLLAPVIHEGESVLWMRRMVLGPREFCLQSHGEVNVPAAFNAVTVELRRL
jgi:hypothetical protein